jgi:hypothetical protein
MVPQLKRLASTMSWEGGVEAFSMNWQSEAGRALLEEER